MLRGNVGNISIRVRHSYSGSGWSVRTVGPEKAEPKKESRRLRPFAWVLGGAIIVSILGGVAILSQRAPQPHRSESRPFSREEFGLSSPGIQTEATGSIEEPIVVSPIPAPVAPVETSAPATPLLPVPPPVEEAVHPLPAVPLISRAAESAGGRSGGAIEREEVQPAHVTGGQVDRIVLTSGSERGAHSDLISSPIVVGPGREKRVVLYTELRGLAGETISHRWERDGQTMAVVPFQVRGDRWRVHSSKRLTPALKGSWRVVVTDSHGLTLASRSFLAR